RSTRGNCTCCWKGSKSSASGIGIRAYPVRYKDSQYDIAIISLLWYDLRRVEGGGKQRRRASGSARRTQSRDRAAQPGERGVTPAGPVVDAAPVRPAQREGRGGHRARGAAVRTRGGRAS